MVANLQTATNPNTVPAVVWPLPGYSTTISPHWGVSSAIGGSDLMVNSTTQPVVSMVAGKVTAVYGASTLGGNSVLIQGNDGLQYYYAHLANTPLVSKGQTVAAGTELGIAGNTGDAAGGPIHLHIGIGKSIIDGGGATGGIGSGFDAISYLRSALSTGNIPALATPQGQADLGSGVLPPAVPQTIVPLPTPNSSSFQDRVKWLAQLLYQAGVTPAEIPKMVSISIAENGSSKVDAVSNTGDYGLWQINCKTWLSSLGSLGISTCQDLFDPQKNALAAAYVAAHDPRGTGAWSTVQDGLDTLHLPAVNTALSGVDYTQGLQPGSAAQGQTGTQTQGQGTTSTTTPATLQTYAQCVGSCGHWDLGLGLGIPDLGCVISCAMSNWVLNVKTAWNNWLQSETEKMWMIGAILVGGIILLVGLSQTNSGQTVINNVKGAASVAAVAA